MQYKVTFEDGSESYLEHYGVKGMKWHQHLKAKTPERLTKGSMYDVESHQENTTVTPYGASHVLSAQANAEAKRNEARVKAGKQAILRFFKKKNDPVNIPYYSPGDPRNSTQYTRSKSAKKKKKTVVARVHNSSGSKRWKPGISAQLSARVPNSLK